jgi:prepilin-type N-terminal cleavage/methylation domain-containing protein
MRPHKNGFTLVELMVVIAIMSVIMVLAVKSFRKSRTQSDVDYWANSIRNQIAAASKRAIATRAPYLVDVRLTSVRWCNIDKSTIAPGPPASTTQTTCPTAPTQGVTDLGPLVTAPDDGETALWATSADAETMPANVGGYVAPTRWPMGANAPLYVGEYSTASTVFANVMTASLPQAQFLGFTAYVRRQGTDEVNKRRRVVVYGASTKTRIIDNY